MGKFKPRELRSDASPDELRRQLNEIQKELAQDLAALAAASPLTPLQTSGYTARYGDIVRVAPPAAGLRVILPPVNRAQPNGRVSVIVESAAGALSVEAVDATVNGADTVTYAAGEGLIEFRLTDTGWYGWSLDLLEQPIAAKSVWANATNATALPAALAGTGAFQYLRVNATNTGLEWAVLSLASFPTQANDTFLGNVSGSPAVPSAVSLSSLAGTDLGFSAHAFSVTSTWSSVLGRGANSGAHNPIVDASQWLGFGSNPGGVSTGQIRADGDLLIRSSGIASLLGASTTGIASLGDVNILSGVISGDINLEVLGSGRVNVTGGFVDYTGQSASTPSVGSGHGLVWTKTDSPSRLYFTDDANTDNKLAYYSDISAGASGGLGRFRKFSASTFSPVGLWNFQNVFTDSSGNGLTLTNGGSAFFRTLGMQNDGTPIYAVAEGATGDLTRTTHDSALAITGDITVQIIVAYTTLGTQSGTSEWVAFEGGDETAANNYLWSIIQGSGTNDTGCPKWFSEHGAGVDDSYSPAGAGTLARVAGASIFNYWAFTRASNVIQAYWQGKPWGAASSALTAPTGGTTSTLRFFNKGTFGEFILCCKISASALSAANIASEYNSTLGPVYGLV